MRRFWKTVKLANTEDGESVRQAGCSTHLCTGNLLVNLDHRNLKTPGGAKLVVPKDRRLLALLIANEWENQSAVLKQHSLPVVSGHVFQ
jgi:ATP synthase F1 complex assembly factor 2